MQVHSTVIAFVTTLFFSCQKDTIDASWNRETEAQFMPVSHPVNDATGGYYIYLPKGYNHSNEYFPLLIFLHGKGQFGNGNSDLDLLLNEAIPEVINNGGFPSSFKINGIHRSMVILCPQFKYYPSPAEVLEVINYAISNYKVDSHQVHIAGMSEGGKMATGTVSSNPGMFASLTTFSGVFIGSEIKDQCSRLSKAQLPIWIFHNDLDEYVSIETTKAFLSEFNSMGPAVVPKFTIFHAWGLYGHDSWTKATNPGYKENGMNIYEWMLQFRSK